MSNLSNIESLFQQRANALFLDAKAAQLMVLNADKPSQSVIEREQSKTSRALLRVEKIAIQEKDLNIKSNLSFLASITSQLNTEVASRVEEALLDIEHIYFKVIGLDQALPELLDLVSIKAATISKIEPIATELPWLYNDLLKFVNQPKYRRVDNKGKTVIVESMRVALSFFGIENLSTIISSLAIKRSLPQITDPYPQIKQRIWEEALATAMSCKKLATVVGVNANNAYCLGMFQVLGKIAITRLYFRHFEIVQREALIESQKGKKHEEHAALSKISPDGEFLNQLIEQHAESITAKLIEKMAMKRVFIANAMREVADNTATKDLSDMAVVLKKAKAYAQYRMLKSHKLIDMQQSKDFVRSLNMPLGSLEVLKATNLRAIDLVHSDT